MYRATETATKTKCHKRIEIFRELALHAAMAMDKTVKCLYAILEALEYMVLNGYIETGGVWNGARASFPSIVQEGIYQAKTQIYVLFN